MSKNLLFKLKYFQLNNIIEELPPNYIVGLLAMVAGGHGLYVYTTSRTDQIIVKHKYQFSRNGFSEFIVVDVNDRHYNMNNSVWFWKWNSLEDWHKIESNDCLMIHYYGWRYPLLGLFPNIVGAQKMITDIYAETDNITPFSFRPFYY